MFVVVCYDLSINLNYIEIIYVNYIFYYVVVVDVNRKEIESIVMQICDVVREVVCLLGIFMRYKLEQNEVLFRFLVFVVKELIGVVEGVIEYKNCIVIINGIIFVCVEFVLEIVSNVIEKV